MTLISAINDFLLEQKVRNNSQKTISTYKQRLKYFYNYIGNLEICDLTYSDIKQYIVFLKNKVKNSNHPYSYVKKEDLILFFNYNF